MYENKILRKIEEKQFDASEIIVLTDNRIYSKAETSFLTWHY